MRRKCTKRTFMSRASAEEALGKMKNEGFGILGSGVRTYRCTRCRNWHIGRSYKGKRRPSLGHGN